MTVTNKEFATNPYFISRCKSVGIEPTKRQASRFRRQKGKAYKEGTDEQKTSNGTAKQS
jgi:hypothetical protein